MKPQREDEGGLRRSQSACAAAAVVVVVVASAPKTVAVMAAWKDQLGFPEPYVRARVKTNFS